MDFHFQKLWVENGDLCHNDCNSKAPDQSHLQPHTQFTTIFLFCLLLFSFSFTPSRWYKTVLEPRVCSQEASIRHGSWVLGSFDSCPFTTRCQRNKDWKPSRRERAFLWAELSSLFPRQLQCSCWVRRGAPQRISCQCESISWSGLLFLSLDSLILFQFGIFSSYYRWWWWPGGRWSRRRVMKMMNFAPNV